METWLSFAPRSEIAEHATAGGGADGPAEGFDLFAGGDEAVRTGLGPLPLPPSGLVFGQRFLIGPTVQPCIHAMAWDCRWRLGWLAAIVCVGAGSVGAKAPDGSAAHGTASSITPKPRLCSGTSPGTDFSSSLCSSPPLLVSAVS